MRFRTALAALCALLLMAEGCLAFSDTADLLDKAEGVTVRLSDVKVQQLTGNDHGRETLNAFLAPLSAEIALNAEAARLAVLASGQEVSALSLEGQKLPDTGLLPHEAFRRLVTETLPDLFLELLPEEVFEPELRKVKIKNLPSSVQRTVLSATQEQLAACGTLEQLKADWAAMSAYLPHHEEMSAWLANLTAVSALTVQRLENEAGEPVAWNITGRVSDGGKDVRNLSLYGGVNGLNAYFTLKLPARSGKNTLELTINLKDKAGKKTNTWSGTITCKRRKDGVSYTVKDTVDLENSHSGREEISGSVKHEVTEDNIKSVWTLVPELTGDGHQLAGTLKVTKKYAQTRVWQVTLAVSAAEGAELKPGAADEAGFAGGLMAYLQGYVGGLSPEDQRQLEHMLRTDAWLNGPVVPAPAAP